MILLGVFINFNEGHPIIIELLQKQAKAKCFHAYFTLL